jgi:hypothetical protein
VSKLKKGTQLSRNIADRLLVWIDSFSGSGMKFLNQKYEKWTDSDDNCLLNFSLNMSGNFELSNNSIGWVVFNSQNVTGWTPFLQ